MLPGDFSNRLEEIQQRIAAAASRSGREASAVTVVAITKTHPVELVAAAHAAGLRDFGENRADELLEKQAALDLEQLRWHFVGHIQSRKARMLVGNCHLIHSVDRLSLAKELSKRAGAAGVQVAALLQVNSSGEETKGGWEISGPDGRETFIREVEQVLSLPQLEVSGLMTMAPFYEDAEPTRPCFARVRELQQQLSDRFPQHSFSILSMGMTNDFEVAVEEGATHVRIGTALFGSRD